MASMQPVLVLMVKEPVMGRVKSRLAAQVGGVRATAFQRANLAALVRRLSLVRRWHIVLAVGPDTTVESAMLPNMPRLPQGSGDLGDRMSRVFSHFPERDVLIMGADIAAVRPTHITDCAQRMRRKGAVLAPSGDGGYWLVGLAAGRRSRGLFEGVRWSTEHALSDTTKAFQRALGHVPALGPERFDIDLGGDLKRWRRVGGMRVVLPFDA
jgi:glycosyltransferase A (GT-A) superfamily protein (DUF2064 family)